ncbi:uncharacterized protein DMENIID0001_125110 [Sergentomyia squamirostris]
MEEKPNPQNLKMEIKTMRICRFCLKRTEPLSNIYSIENRLKSSVPLPLQIMACCSIEVFVNDGMPAWICDGCRVFMEHWYRYKQICKKSDTILRQYHLTGDLPERLELPQLPAEFHKSLGKPPPPKSSPAKTFISQSPPVSPSTSAASKQTFKRPAPQIQNVQVLSFKKPKKEVFEITTVKSPQKVSQEPPKMKILNKSPRILNKPTGRIAPVLSEPIIQTNESGTVEIITEIVDSMETYNEPDPIKNAAPVETNVFPCPHCERSFPLRQLLDIHVKNHTRERGFECAVCEKRFFSKYDLGKHMLTHTGERPYTCVVCERSFSRSTLLHRHEKIHTDTPKYLCGYCERPFLSMAELEKHSEKHRKNRPFHCRKCDKSFAFKQGLERHEVVHDKDQPFPCEYCDKSFSTPSKLARHLTAHAGHRPFPCKLCQKSYVLSHHLTRHMRSHTNSVATYNCFDCGATFSTRDELIYHSAVHATQSLVCPLCKEKFGDLDEVTEHIKSHTEGDQFACEFCDLIFTTELKLEEHTNSEHYEEQQKYGQGVKQEEVTEETITEEFIITGEEEDSQLEVPMIKEEKVVDREVKTTSTMIKCTYGKASKKAKVDAEFVEVRRSSRPPKTKHYATVSHDEIKEDDDEEEDQEIKELQEEEYSPDDETYRPEEEVEEEEEAPKVVKKKSPRGRPAKSSPGNSTQQKMSDLLREAGRKAQNQSIAEKTIKNLPKGVTVTRKDNPSREKAPVQKAQPVRNDKRAPPPTKVQEKPRERAPERRQPSSSPSEKGEGEKTTEIKIGNQILKVKKVVMMKKSDSPGASTSKSGK